MASGASFWDSAECIFKETDPTVSHQGISWCSACKGMYCISCWGRQPLHQRSRPTAEQHEATELGVARLIDDILRPEADLNSQTERHLLNKSTKWFGVMIDENGKRLMQDFKRFDDLAFNEASVARKQFPCVVAFVGATGAGKSTLINALMKVRDTSLLPRMGPPPCRLLTRVIDQRFFRDHTRSRRQHPPSHQWRCAFVPGPENISLQAADLLRRLRGATRGELQAGRERVPEPIGRPATRCPAAFAIAVAAPAGCPVVVPERQRGSAQAGEQHAGPVVHRKQTVTGRNYRPAVANAAAGDDCREALAAG